MRSPIATGRRMPRRGSNEPSSAMVCRPLGCLLPFPMVATFNLYQNDSTGGVVSIRVKSTCGRRAHDDKSVGCAQFFGNGAFAHFRNGTDGGQLRRSRSGFSLLPLANRLAGHTKDCAKRID